ncbi:MAG: DUF4434 domain-containing protein [Phycisphaerales bacterium]|nr:DUF4434 domain-containing protein [Phycisphaerales bacterium]
MPTVLWIALVLLPLCAWAGDPTESTSGTTTNAFDRFGDHYPVILMAVPATDDDFARVKEIGADYVHLYGMSSDASQKGMDWMRAYLDMAQKYGLKVMFDLDGQSRMEKGDIGIEEMRRIVTEFKDHPAMGFWYLDDEPDYNQRVKPATVKQFYEAVKQASPNIPVCIVMTTGPYWKDYQQGYDIFSFDTYPVSDQPFPSANLQVVTDFNRQAVKLGKPVIPCLQAFNWVFMWTGQEVAAGQYDSKNPSPRLKAMRYPTLAEMRYWNFTTLLQGSRGVMYYSYLRGIQSELESQLLAKVEPDWTRDKQIDPHWVDTTLRQSIHELSAFTELVKPAWKLQLIRPGRNSNLLEGVWGRDGKRYVVMINTFPLKRTVYLNDAMKAPFENATVTPWNFSRQVTPHVGSDHQTVIDEMHPWEVLVWEINPVGTTGLPRK